MSFYEDTEFKAFKDFLRRAGSLGGEQWRRLVATKQVKYFPKSPKFFTAAVIQHTNYPLSIFRSEPDNLHLYIGSTDWSKHFLQLVPHTEHWATQNVVCPTPKTNFTWQTHRCFLTVSPPVGRINRKQRSTTTQKTEAQNYQVDISITAKLKF